MIRNLIYIIPAIILFLFSSCEDVIEVEINEEDSELIAVEAKITTEDEPFVILSRALKISVDEPLPGISGAIVSITDDASPTNSINLIEDNDRAGYYRVPDGVDYFGIPGREYTVTIQTEGIMLTATDKLFPVEPIDSIQVLPSLRGDLRFLAVFTFGQETPGVGNYYKWDIYINDTLLHDAENLSFASDEFVDGNYVNGLEIFTDYHDPNDKSERKLKFMDTIYVKQTSISSFAYDYYYQLINQSTTGFLFSVPPANIPSNFTSSDGKEVLGLFTAHDVSTSESVIIDESIESQLNERP